MTNPHEIATMLRDDEIQYYKDIVDKKPARLHTKEILAQYEPPHPYGGTLVLLAIVAATMALLLGSEGSLGGPSEELGMIGCAGMIHCVAALWYLHDYLECKRAEEVWPGILKTLDRTPSLVPVVFYGAYFCIIAFGFIVKYQDYQRYLERIAQWQASHGIGY